MLNIFHKDSIVDICQVLSISLNKFKIFSKRINESVFNFINFIGKNLVDIKAEKSNINDSDKNEKMKMSLAFQSNCILTTSPISYQFLENIRAVIWNTNIRINKSNLGHN